MLTYLSAPLPDNETERIEALVGLDVLDTPPEDIFDALTNTAATLCDAPIALISLVDEHRQWFKSRVGLDDVREMPRAVAFCAHVVSAGELLEVVDATLDDRFAGNPLVTGSLNVRYYAGAPILLADGVTLGSLCVIDHEPRKLSDQQLQTLRDLADVAARGLESRAFASRALALAEKSERDLARSRELLAVTLESIGDAVIRTDIDGAIQWMNPAAERMTGWTRAEALGKTLDQVFVIVDEDTRLPARNPVITCLARTEESDEGRHITLISRDYSEFGIENSASPIRDAGGQVLGAVLTFHDVSEQRRLNSEMSHRATHDMLTGLPNRAAFESRLADLLAAGDTGDHVVLYVDLDHFKLVNDACGHSAGDQLLRQISAIIRSCVRGHDMLARLGGDEFGLLLAHCDAVHARVVAQKICDQMEEFRFVYQGRRFRLGTSIGLVPIDDRWASVTALLQVADAACYAAKEGGRNRVHVWLDSDTALDARNGEMQWVSRLELALDEDRFELFGQRIAPIGEPSAALHFEVLLRMREPGGALVPPAAFLSIAERFHLATRIDRVVVGKAFEWMMRAEHALLKIDMMSINLSGQSLVDRAFHRDVSDMIRSAPFDASALCFEITETAAITHLADARAFIDDVRRLGVKVALDDFGAGASSFGYLKSLPVDFLKIDGHFITTLLDDELNHAAVRCFCEVARVVGVRTIAEFVEREDVRERLRVLGVDMAQGYLIHEPEPLAALFAGAPSRPLQVGASSPINRPPRAAKQLRQITIEAFNPNCIDMTDQADVMLWADLFSIPVERLVEIVAKVGPMRAAVAYYVKTVGGDEGGP